MGTTHIRADTPEALHQRVQRCAVSAFKTLLESARHITEKRRRRLSVFTRVALAAAAIAMCPVFAWAGPCDLTWDGEKVAQIARGHNPTLGTQLLGNNKQVVAELTGAQILAISEAKDAIAKELGRSPSLLFCSDNAPNAFAMNTPDGEVVGVTVGLAKLMNGDRDMAAMVIGHEYAHLVLGHLAAAEQHREFLALLGEVAGAVIEYKTQTKTHIQGVGINVGRLGANLISTKFDRNQERQADEAGFRYMVNAGFNPLGAVRLAEIMQRYGAGGIGLFFDNHPGWPERTARFQALIKASPTAQATIARTGTRTALASASTGGGQTQVALVPVYQVSDPEKTLADGVAALEKSDFPTGVTAIRSSAAAGYAPAQRALGHLYSEGSAGLPKDEVEAVRLFRLAVAQSNADAMNDLGVMYAHGRGGLSVDEVEAIRLFRASAKQGSAQALSNLGDVYIKGKAGIEKDCHAAQNYYLQAGDGGYPDALATLGAYYITGASCFGKDTPKGVALYRQAADKGSAAGRYLLALCYQEGLGELQKDYVEAVKLLQMAADQGEPRAQSKLGAMYYYGALGVPKSETKAAELYKLAADRNDAYAQAYLGRMTVVGQGGLSKNPTEGVRLLRLSAAQGNAEGEFFLGALYKFGSDGVPRNAAQAVKWLQMAADQGHAAAQANLGSMYLNGEGGLSESSTEALRLVRLSAAQGNALGQFNLGAMYEFGEGGLRKDNETAASWYRKAAAQGHADAARALRALNEN
jgi:TPR repeat protein